MSSVIALCILGLLQVDLARFQHRENRVRFMRPGAKGICANYDIGG